MGLFDMFKDKGRFADLTREQMMEKVKTGELVPLYLMDPRFGGAEDMSNTIFVTPEAAQEKEKIDDELEAILEAGRSVKKFRGNIDYKGKSAVPSRIIITAIIDDQPFEKIINIW